MVHYLSKSTLNSPLWPAGPHHKEKQPIKMIRQYHLTQVHYTHILTYTLSLPLTHKQTHTQRIIQCTPGNNSPTLIYKHTHCWVGKSIISQSSTYRYPPTCVTLTWRNSLCGSQRQGLQLLGSSGSRPCRCSLSAPRGARASSLH